MPEFTKQVRPCILPEIELLIQSYNNYSLTADTPYKTNIVEWLKPVIDLSDFYVYPINGITEGLNYWMGNESRSIIRDPGDYEWVDTSTGTHEVKYISVPNSIDGNFKEIPIDIPVVLDIAYVGTTAIQKIPVTPNIEKVFFSLSKPFGLRNIRTGWYFTRKPDIKLHRLHIKANYYNYVAHNIAELVISQFSVDYVYNKFVNKQKNICNQYNLIPSDTVWLAISSSDNYYMYRRHESHAARLCITEFLNEQC